MHLRTVVAPTTFICLGGPQVRLVTALQSLLRLLGTAANH